MQIIKTATQYHYTSFILREEDVRQLTMRHNTLDEAMRQTLRARFATCAVAQTDQQLTSDASFQISSICDLGKQVGLNHRIEMHIIDFETIQDEDEYNFIFEFIGRYRLLVIKWDDPFEAALHQLNHFILFEA
ncbi:tripartite motif-containing protein 2 [Novosphingobium sp. PY1]|nr:tripartite motif-containing protein 2 [Novosphingobium sp. PY1]